ncbi:MAG: carboxypeptidase regulatory-like domain-containing protein [Acidobacteria bacterium]|nr:carboxypeptidase regulatory-like domain-containing protein [Acidobacteriota bacterium]
MAQTAQVTGRVTDSRGAVVPDAVLTLIHISTGTSRKTVSNQEGIYNFPFLAPGRCLVMSRLTTSCRFRSFSPTTLLA